MPGKERNKFEDDKVTKKERKSKFKGFAKFLKISIPFPERNYSSFPAVKIGRMGVNANYQRQGLGTSVLNLTKEMFVTNNRTGCRFLTVDAYNDKDTIDFYKKNDFELLLDEDEINKTRIMFFDLMRFKKAFEKENAA